MRLMMTDEQIAARLCRLAAEQVGAVAAEVTPDSHLVKDLNFDSLDQAEYAMTIEDEFDVSIPDAAAAQVRTVGDAIRMLHEAMKPRREAAT